MSSRITALTLLEPKSAIARDPLIVSPTTTVIDAIAQMGSMLDHLPRTAESQLVEFHLEARSSCVLVVENEQLVGVLTERDVVRLSAQPQRLEGLLIQQVMTEPIATLRESAFTDLELALNLLQQYSIRYMPILDEQDCPVGLVTRESLQWAIARQQSTAYQQLQAELVALAQWRNRYEVAERASGQVLYEYDLLRDFATWGANTEIILGYPASALPTYLAGWVVLIHPDDRGQYWQATRLAAAGKTPLFTQYRVQHQAGHYIWIEDRGQWLIDDQGKATGVIGIVIDISDRKRSEEALQKSEAHQRALMNAIPDLIMRTNQAGIYLEFAATPNFPIVGNIPEMVGTHVSDTLPPDAAQKRLEFIQLALQTNSIQIYEQDLSIDGKTQIEEVRVVPYSEDEVLTLVRDISDRKQAEAGLQSLVESTAAVTGKDFFSTLAQQLMIALKVQHVLVTKQVGDHLQTLAYWQDGQPQPELTFALSDAPCCASAIEQGRFYCPRGLQEQFAEYPLIQALQADSYLGMPLTSMSGQRMGNLCILDSKPMENIQWAEAFLRIFAMRAAAELERQQATEALQQLNQELEAGVEQRTTALRDSEMQLSIIFNQAAVGMNLATPNGRYLKVNQKLCDILGYTQEELLTKNFREVAHPEDLNKGEAERRQLYAGAINSFSLEKRCLHKDGSTVWINLTVSLVRKSSGEPDYSIGVVEDISERVRLEAERQHTEEALRQSEEQFRQLAENIQSVFWISNANCSQILYISPAYETVWGRSRASLYASPQAFAEAIHPEDQARVFAFLATQSQGYDHEYRILQPDGTLRWVRDRAFPIYNDQGEVYRLTGIAEDITARKQAEETLNRQLATIEASVDGIAILNTNSEYTYLNEAHVKLLGYSSAEELLGKTWRVLYSATEVSRFERDVVPKLMANRAWRGESIATRPDGSTFNQEVSLTLTADGETICICRDISDRKQAEVEILRNRDLREAIFNESTDAIFLVDADTRITIDCNRRAVELFEASSKDELLNIEGNTLQRHQFTEEELKAISQEIIEKGFWSREVEYITCKGNLFWGNLAVKQISIAGRTMNLVQVTDVSERKQSEMLLKVQQAFLRRLIDTIPNLIFVKDWEGRFTLVNQATANVYNSTIEALVGKTDADFNPNLAEVEQFLAADREVMTTITTKILEETVTSSDGKQRYFQTIKTPIVSADGQSKEILGIATDISDRQQIEEQLRRSEAHLVEAQRIAHVGSWEFDMATQRITWSAETFRMFGRDSEQQEPTYEELLQSVHPEDQDQYRTMFQQAAEDVKPFEVEHRILQPDGSIRYVLGKGQPVLDATGNLISFLGTALDITNRKQFEEQLRQTNEQLANANGELARATRLKDEFLANMSHELRTPLNAILGMAEGLQEGVFGEINQRQIKALQTVEQSGFHLLALINDILDIAKIESGQLELDCTPTAVAPLCQSSLTFVKQQALKKRIQLKIKLPRNLPDLFVDERRIRQVLINLLNNAVKFTPEGGCITLEINYQQLSGATEALSQNYLRIAVIDTGIGIAPEHINKLFQPFIQIDSAFNRQYEGTGLGLALVKRIVELHGGQVGLTSEVGVGSCFTIDLPCATTTLSSPNWDQPAPSIELGQPIAPSPLILLAEDNEANISTVSSYLRAKGYRILLSKNGEETITLAQSSSPDLILMDIQMPGVDGLEAIQQIRHHPNLVNVPIIALTALAMMGDRDRCLAAGASDYLTKPVKLKQLATTIQQLLTR